jgi:hypothetical protein
MQGFAGQGSGAQQERGDHRTAHIPRIAAGTESANGAVYQRPGEPDSRHRKQALNHQ